MGGREKKKGQDDEWEDDKKSKKCVERAHNEILRKKERNKESKMDILEVGKTNRTLIILRSLSVVPVFTVGCSGGNPGYGE